MSVSAWVMGRIQKRRGRSSIYSSRVYREGKEEFIIKIPGWSGELRKYMTNEEAEAYIEKTNKAAFMSAAEASKRGLFGVEEFSKNGRGQSGFRSVMMKNAARAFGKKADKEENEKV